MSVAKRYKKKKKLGSFPYVSVVLSITLALFVIGLFGLLLLQSNKLKNVIRDNITMQVYLDKFITENDRIRINKLLAQKDYVAKENGSAAIEYIPREKAAEIFIKNTGEDFIEFLGENPLRDAFVIRIAPEFQQEEQLKKIKEELSKADGVFEVVYVQNLVQAINDNITKISLFLMGFATILLITIVILINNTIRLALFSQRFLIRSMQLVGAKGGFIISPFVWRAAFQGLMAGVLAASLLYMLLLYTNNVIEELKALQTTNELLLLLALILLLGVLIASVSTYRAVRKYLNMSLDELY